jgi:hypothetical protein
MNRLVLICEIGKVSDLVREQHTEGQSYTPPISPTRKLFHQVNHQARRTSYSPLCWPMGCTCPCVDFSILHHNCNTNQWYGVYSLTHTTDMTNIRFVSTTMTDAILMYSVSWVLVDRYHPSSSLSNKSHIDIAQPALLFFILPSIPPLPTLVEYGSMLHDRSTIRHVGLSMGGQLASTIHHLS